MAYMRVCVCVFEGARELGSQAGGGVGVALVTLVGQKFFLLV